MNKKLDKPMNIPTISLGENKVLFVPLEQDGVNNAIGFFYNELGTFDKPIYLDKIAEHIDEITPVAAIRFTTKKAIDFLIKFLKRYKKDIYGKEFKND